MGTRGLNIASRFCVDLWSRSLSPGVDYVWERQKFQATKMLKNAKSPPPSLHYVSPLYSVLELLESHP